MRTAQKTRYRIKAILTFPITPNISTRAFVTIGHAMAEIDRQYPWIGNQNGIPNVLSVGRMRQKKKRLSLTVEIVPPGTFKRVQIGAYEKHIRKIRSEILMKIMLGQSSWITGIPQYRIKVS